MRRVLQVPRGRRGFVLITMSFAAVAMIGALGVAVDLGRTFIAKTETQAFCDAAALAATLKLDGTSAGISAASTVVAASRNAWKLDSTSISNYNVSFGTSASGPWVANPSPASGYIYTKVTAAVPLDLLFIPIVVSQSILNVNSAAIAGQIVQTAVPRGLAPFTAVSTDSTSANFGFVVGNQYDIQWPAFNGTRAGCSPSTPDGCFVRSACSGDSLDSKTAVTQYWGSSNNGYWGSNSTSTISQEVLDLIQLQPLSINQMITLSTGNKNAEASALDTRVNQDGDVNDNTPSAYLANDYHNGRRLIGLPVVNPTPAGTYVIGYGAFLLISNSNPSNYYTAGTGNDGFCAIYAGPYTQGGTGVGGGGTGYYQVKLVQ